jgi:hypothetical protein
MEGQLWKAIVMVLTQVDKRRKRTDEDFSDEAIVKVFYWAAIHDRPVSWACEPRNWPCWARRQKLPSDTTMSRRQRTTSVVALLNAIEQRVTRPTGARLYWMIDGKPLVIGGCSKDRQAGYGRAAGTMAKGYKLHVLVDGHGGLAAWRVAPMNKDERVMARRLLKAVEIHGYVVADANYDSNALHQQCDARRLPIRDATALWLWASARAPCPKSWPSSLNRLVGKPSTTLRASTTSRPHHGRTLLRQRDQLGRRHDTPTTLGSNASPRSKMGSSQTHPYRTSPRPMNNHLRRPTGNPVALRADSR